MNFKRPLIILSTLGIIIFSLFWVVSDEENEDREESRAHAHERLLGQGSGVRLSSPTTTQVEKIYEVNESIVEAKTAFLIKNGIDPESFIGGPPFTKERYAGSEARILFRFYLERLQSDDPEVVAESFELFRRIFQGDFFDGTPREISENTDRDVVALRSYFAMLKPDAPFSFQRNLSGHSYIYDFVTTITPMLADPSVEEDVQDMLNFVTFFVYENNDVEWWIESFQDSKLAGLFQGLPEDEWMARSE